MTTILMKRRSRVFSDTAAEMDKVCEDDRRFFLLHKDRSHRVRLASSAEITRWEVMAGESAVGPGMYPWLFVLVRQLAPGARMRTYVHGAVEMAGQDIGEAAARGLWDIAAEHNPSIRANEAELHAMLRSMGARLKDGGSR